MQVFLLGWTLIDPINKYSRNKRNVDTEGEDKD